MWYEKIDKLTAFVLVLAIAASVGMYIKSQNKEIVAEISSPDAKVRFAVTIDGEVENPGTYSVAEGSRVCDVIYAAGGITQNADTDLLDLDARVIAKTRITVPSVHSREIPDVLPVININTADKDELTVIPGIGEVTAQRIIDYRETNGKFTDISDIMNIRGIGEKKFNEIKDYIITSEINDTEEQK